MSDLANVLADFEQERISILQKTRRPKLIALVLLVIAIPLFFLEYILPSIACGIGAVIAFVISELPKQRFKQSFKEKVVGELAKQIDPSVTYAPKGGWHYTFLHDIGLINTRPNQGKSEDFFKGRIGETDIAFCEQKAEKKTTRTDSKGRTTTHIEKLFSGLVLEADFHKSFQGETIILPDWAENSGWTWLAKKFQANSRDGNKIVQLENPEFEKLFAVYGSDQVEARYILSPAMMTRMVALYKKLSSSSKCKIFVAFKAEKMYLAIDWNNNFFEYDFSKSVEEEVRETFDELKLCTGIVEDLNLNTRIWSKQ